MININDSYNQVTVIEEITSTTVTEERSVVNVNELGTPVLIDNSISVQLNLIATGSISAEVNVFQDIFLIKSGSVDYMNITNNSTELRNNIFLIRNHNDDILFKVDDGVAQFKLQPMELTNPVTSGLMYFTSSSFFVSLD